MATKEERKIEEAKALKLRLTGRTYAEIAKALGVKSTRTAWNRVQAALDDMRPHADISEYRAQQRAELEVLRTKLMEELVRWKHGGDLSELLGAGETLIKLHDREAKLLGLDRAPTPWDEMNDLDDEQLAAQMAHWRQEAGLSSVEPHAD